MIKVTYSEALTKCVHINHVTVSRNTSRSQCVHTRKYQLLLNPSDHAPYTVPQCQVKLSALYLTIDSTIEHVNLHFDHALYTVPKCQVKLSALYLTIYHTIEHVYLHFDHALYTVPQCQVKLSALYLTIYHTIEHVNLHFEGCVVKGNQVKKDSWLKTIHVFAISKYIFLQSMIAFLITIIQVHMYSQTD